MSYHVLPCPTHLLFTVSSPPCLPCVQSPCPHHIFTIASLAVMEDFMTCPTVAYHVQNHLFYNMSSLPSPTMSYQVFLNFIPLWPLHYHYIRGAVVLCGCCATSGGQGSCHAPGVASSPVPAMFASFMYMLMKLAIPA